MKHMAVCMLEIYSGDASGVEGKRMIRDRKRFVTNV